MMYIGLTRVAGMMDDALTEAGHAPHRKHFTRGRDTWIWVDPGDHIDYATRTSRATIQIRLRCGRRPFYLLFRLRECGCTDAFLDGKQVHLGDWKTNEENVIAAVVAMANIEVGRHLPECLPTPSCWPCV